MVQEIPANGIILMVPIAIPSLYQGYVKSNGILAVQGNVIIIT
jgi:hypothetical protein